ncbi:hypothetical protein DBR37_03570 [Herminiimonas sp. KBW02]|uniref:hypothetical protein n=1 Tax=Herminiimonas sp. KBW02 TaxID=2153363 RepID=UPI000F596536|nr:hypothetical protein [Herminiimonas sp. KBW02]RQO37278.1 hypothetical protein DBR37_03570 [Herminiimonas sp. KBW02]
MFSSKSLDELLAQKKVRIVLAVLCTYFALTGVYQLFTGVNQADWLRGGGNLLVWGGFAVSNAMKAYGRTQPGINIPINIGVVLVVASWLVRM